MQPPSDQRFYRGTDRIIGGVCSGLAEGFHVDTFWVRVAFVALVVFAQGIGIVLYVVLWVIMPERNQDRPSGRSGFDSMGNDLKRAWADLRAQFGGRPPAGPSTYATTAPVPPPVASDPTAPHAAQVVQSTPPPTAAPPPAPPRSAPQNQSLILGVILVVVGLAFLGANTGFVNWSVFWPAALIALGIVLLVRNLERRP